MRKRISVLCIVFVLALSLATQAQEQMVVQFKDARGDDWGAGALAYPDHPVYVPGLFDLLLFEVTMDETYVYFDLQFAELTNPFQAPEGYFHQRIEVYITTGAEHGRSEIRLGHHKLETSPKYSWDLHLTLAPFGESRLYAAGVDQIKLLSEEVHCSVLADGKTIRAHVDNSLLPHPNSAWGYYVLVGAFDGLALDFWRDLGEGTWQVRGAGLPIFDLLAPRVGRRSQRVQLSTGVLYPMYSRRTNLLFWFVGGLILIAISFFLWRWFYGRT